MPAIGNWNALQRDILAWLCEWIAVCLYVCVRCIHLRNWDALHALIARRYGPNGPYYGFLNRIDGSFASFASWRIRFDSGSFIELTVITRPRLVSAPVVWLKYEVDLRALFMENALGEKAGDVSITRVEGRELGLAPWNRPSPKELWGRSPNEAAVKVSR